MIKLVELDKKYGRKRVVKGVTLCLDNENYGLVGPNGAGKTTLIRMMAGVIKPSGGKIICEENGRIGYLSQRFGCIPELTVYDQLAYFACMKKIPNAMQKAEIDRVLKLVHLEDKRNEKCRKLSGGMIRRLGIAQALLGEPELLLLDEPTVGLDPDERKTFSEIVAQLRGKMTVLLSTHIIQDIANTCDKMIVLEKGVVAGMVDMEECRDRNPDDVYFEVVHGMDTE